MSEMPPLYLEVVKALAKAEGKLLPKAFLRDINKLMDSTDARAHTALVKILKRARLRFRRKLNVAKFTDLFATVHKSETDDVRARLKAIIDAAFIGSAADLVDAESDLIDALAQQFATVYEVDLNFRLVNQKAVDYLTSNAENYFSTLSDSQAEGLLAEAGKVLASEDGYTIKDVAKSIYSAFLDTKLFYPTESGSQSIGSSDWAMLTARTETARAASYAQKSTLENIGLATWQWQAEDSCCDDCESNSDEIVAIGDNFPSGDSEPPAHANCLLPGTLISTRRGLIPIEDIRVGDEVLTHLGRYRRVLALSRQQICEDILEIRVGETSISVTGNHPIYHRYGWSRADALQVGDEVGTMQPEPMLSFPGKTN
jgi:hypothetical protein